MSNTSQNRAVRDYRKRIKQRGLSRFEVLGPTADRELIRSLAQRLAANGDDAPRVRAAIQSALSVDDRPKGGLLKALRESPLVGADLDLRRPFVRPRKVDL